MAVGFYGKLPSHGDFLRRRVSDAFVERWDPWLQQCMASSRAQLGDRWLDLYLTSPVWRFACVSEVCGPAPLLGVVVPSVDRVGRYFPLTVVTELETETSLVAAATGSSAFFERAEQLLVETLAQEQIDFEAFDAELLRLGTFPTSAPSLVTLDGTAGALLAESMGCGAHVPLGAVGELGPVLSQLLFHRLAELFRPLSLWWTDGSTAVDASALIIRGLPEPESFKAFLDGAWLGERWRAVSATVQTPLLPVEETLRLDRQTMTCRSSGATDVGRVRRVNQDAFLERPEIGLWVVADGLGGHSDGDVASRMVCDALADFSQTASFEEMVDGVRARMREVNDYLLRTSSRSLGGAKMGSTVVVLLIRGAECAALWAGDSRIYRWRDKQLLQLTVDHSAAVSASGARSNVVTRAVGVAPGLLLDSVRNDVRDGDRFLLCSDGLTRLMPDEEIEVWMHQPDLDAAVDGLIEATLAAGAPDNVTVLIVDARADLAAAGTD